MRAIFSDGRSVDISTAEIARQAANRLRELAEKHQNVTINFARVRHGEQGNAPIEFICLLTEEPNLERRLERLFDLLGYQKEEDATYLPAGFLFTERPVSDIVIVHTIAYPGYEDEPMSAAQDGLLQELSSRLKQKLGLGEKAAGEA